MDLHPELYKQFIEIGEGFCSEEGLRDQYHKVHSDRCESLKRKHLCCTIANLARTYLTTAINLVGYFKYFNRLLLHLGIKPTLITITQHVPACTP
jgi:hypothetical protein